MGSREDKRMQQRPDNVLDSLGAVPVSAVAWHSMHLRISASYYTYVLALEFGLMDG